MVYNPNPTAPRRPPTGHPVLRGSVYRPHVLTRDRLLHWTSPFSLQEATSRPFSFRPETTATFDCTLAAALEAGSRTNYGGGLARFHEFCDAEGVPEQLCMPASEELVATFAASWAGRVGPSVVSTWISGVRAWHVLHRAPWHVGDVLRLTKAGVAKLAPTSSRPPRPPVSIPHLTALRDHLDFGDTRDSCIFACATVAFFGLLCLGELLPEFATADASRFPRRRHAVACANPGDPEYFILSLPWTKTTHWAGADVTVSSQPESVDPVLALRHHLQINTSVPADAPLFAYLGPTCWCLLSKAALLSRCNAIWAGCGLPVLTGHSFRIGGATELLSRGVPPEVVAVQGRWRSDAFYRYWRHIRDYLPSWTSAAPNLVTHADIETRVERWRERHSWVDR